MPHRVSLPFGLTLICAAVLISGCGRSSAPLSPGASGSSSGTDQAQVSSAMASTPELIEDQVYESPEETSIGGGAPGSTALIHPLRFWRHITDVRRTFEFAFSDTDSTGRPTRALVTIRKVMRGTFNIATDLAPEDSLPPDTSTIGIVRKRLADLWERHVLLRRVRDDGTGEPQWKVAGISGVKVTSFQPSSGSPPIFGDTRVVKLRIQSAAGDVTIGDPLAPFLLRRIPVFDPAQDVTLTVTTLRNDDVVVLIRPFQRRAFHNNGDNTYTLFWHASAEAGVRHLGVDALSNGTLFDDARPYDSQAWIVPYRVAPGDIAEFMP